MRLSVEAMQAPEFLEDRYTQIELLGAGGMGVVYRAFDRTLQKDVAIKTLPGQKLTPEVAIRFQQEARTASKLKHTNLVTILDFGISPTGEPFLVMDFAAGVTLDSIIRERGTMDAGSALEIVNQICEGMKHAHANGIIHRDLKPSNVIVDISEHSVKVVDFGIAKMAEEGDGLILTPQGNLIGTPSYMSPEQIAGEVVDARSDIYSIGCILFHLLAGRPPFESDTSLEVLLSARTKRAPSIVEANPHVSIPHEVEELVAKSLSKDRLKRQPSVEALQDELGVAMDALEQFEKERTAGDGNDSRSGHDLLTPATRPSIPRRLRRSPRAVLIGALLAFGVLIPVTAIIYMIMITPSVQMTTESFDDALQLNPLAVRSSHRNAIEANKGKPDWEQHFNCRVQDGKLRYEALDSVTPDDLRKMADQKLKVFSLDLSRFAAPITVEWCQYISRIDVEQLDFSNSRVTDEGLEYVGKILNLTKLELTSCNISDKGVAFLRNLKKLETLQISKTKVTDKCLETVKCFKRLRRLELSNTPVTDSAIAKLKDLPLQEICILGCSRVTERVLEPLAKKGRLIHINASDTRITDAGLTCLRPCKGLYTLKLADCRGVSDAAVCFFAANFPRLHYLDISGTSATSKCFPDLVKLKELRDLHLCSLGLTDKDLVPLKSLKEVSKLNLSANRITDGGLKSLVDMPSLRRICLNHCDGITSSGAGYLQSAHQLKFGEGIDIEITSQEAVSRIGEIFVSGGADSSRE